MNGEVVDVGDADDDGEAGGVKSMIFFQSTPFQGVSPHICCMYCEEHGLGIWKHDPSDSIDCTDMLVIGRALAVALPSSEPMACPSPDFGGSYLKPTCQ
tara:strand:- start:8124 stop:8420 length:297 start_codon:yes stop_codon:yes gene_type:complete